MSKLEKAKERIKKVPKDYTFQEARSLLLSLGFMDANKDIRLKSEILSGR